MDKQDKINLAVAVVLVTAIMGLWNYFFPTPSPQNTPQEISQVMLPAGESSVLSLAPESAVKAVESKRLIIDTPKLKGSLRLQGAVFDDIILKSYHEKPDTKSPLIKLLVPSGQEDGYFAELGWLSQTQGLELPNGQSLWQTQDQVLSNEKPVTLSWKNPQGLIFTRTIAIDENYMFTITDRIENSSSTTYQMYPYGAVVRENTPKIEDFFILHEGPIGYLNSNLIEQKYKDLKGSSAQMYDSVGGWLGITDKYWLTAFIPDKTQKIKTSYSHQTVGSQDRYDVRWVGQTVALEPSASHSYTAHFFAGAKVLALLDDYEIKMGVTHFDLAVDFGWFYLITKPIFSLITTLHDWLGNFGLAILLMTVMLKLAFFPLANKSYRSMARLRMLQPKIQQLQSRYSDDKMKMNQELMELYKREKVNPVGGCLPMLLQIPVFFGLYKVLFVTLEMRQAPFYGWIQDLSAPDPTSLFNAFGLIPWDPPSFLMIGAWPLLMGASMFVQQKLNPAPTDPIQAKMFMFLPLMFTFMLASFPAGLVIYWTWNNLLTIAQQWSIMRLSDKAVPVISAPTKKGIKKS